MIRLDVRVISLLYWMAQLFHCSMDIGDVCPLTTFCADRVQGVNISHQSSSCCFPCSCHRNCKLVGTCCHDAETDDHLQYLYPCASQYEIYSKYLSIEFASTDASYSRVVTGCHSNAEDISNETRSRCNKAHQLDDLVFVTGKSSGITYINRHCALCNGEKDVDDWNLITVLHDAKAIFSINASFEARDEFLLRKGSVMSTPPTDFAALSTFCYKSPFESCNVSKRWDIYNKDIEDKCNFYTNMYYESNRGYFYKNPFCYICDRSQKDVFINTDCGNLMDRLFSNKFTNMRQLILTKLPRRKTSIRDEKSRPGCGFGETLDRFTGTCTKLLCPPGTAIVNDHCEPMFPEDTGISMVLSFDVVFEEPISMIHTRNMDFLKELREVFVTKVKQYYRQCPYCQSWFLTMNDDFVFAIAYKTSPGCSYLQFLNVFSVLCRGTPVKVFSDSIQRNVSLYGANIADDKTRISVLTESNLYEGICGKKVHFTEAMVPCPSIVISLSVIESLSLKRQTKDEIRAIGTNLGNGTLRVCLEDYDKLHAISTSSFMSHFVSTLVSYGIFFLKTIQGYMYFD